MIQPNRLGKTGTACLRKKSKDEQDDQGRAEFTEAIADLISMY
jgi:hypothetical protein